MKRNLKYSIVVILLLFISIGYSALSSSLTINGNTTIDKNTWQVAFTKVENESINGSSGSSIISGATINSSKDTISFQVKLSKPGDYYTVRIYRANQGTIDAKLDNYTVTGLDGATNYMKLTLTDPNSSTEHNDAYGNLMESPNLLAGTSNYIDLKLEFKKDISASDLLTDPATLNISIKLNYVQKD